MPQTRKDSSIFLIGHYGPQIIGGKLPSNLDLLKVLFFNVREVKLSVEDSVDLVIKETLTFWSKARIPTKAHHDCGKKLVKLYNEWRNLEKSKNKTFPSDLKKRIDLRNKLDDLFDIAHANALNMIKIREDREFLMSQRKRGRPGFMFGVDWDLHRKEARAQERKEKQIAREQKNAETLDESAKTFILASSSEDEKDGMIPCTSTVVNKRGTKKVITPRVVAALDKCQLSDRHAMHVISSIIDALGFDISTFSLNRTSLQRERKQHRSERANKLREHFQGLTLQAATIHWDGKMFTSSKDQGKYDRIAIIITSGDIEKILCIPEIDTSTGKDQAEAIFEALMDWGVEESIEILCCDTTASNLGRFKGCAVLLEQYLGRELLYLPCRHHIFELILAAAFYAKMSASKGPEIKLFVKFKKAWCMFDLKTFNNVIEDPQLSSIIEKFRSSILEFTEAVLTLEKQPRDDYRELLILTQVFLGKLDRLKTFSPPGPIHSARWMAIAIYCLKVYLFRGQFEMEDADRKGIRDLCVFIVIVYVKAWFQAPLPIRAPHHDLQLMKTLLEYESVDFDIAKAAQLKFINHLWYLTPECAAFSFFDDNVSYEIKPKMVDNLSREGTFDDVKRVVLTNFSDIENREIFYFVSKGTNNFFKRLTLPKSFLRVHPKNWSKNKDYQKSLGIVKRIKCVNDVAERAIKLISDYNEKLTMNEEQRQNIIQIVSDYRKKFPNVRKQTLRHEID